MHHQFLTFVLSAAPKVLIGLFLSVVSFSVPNDKNLSVLPIVNASTVVDPQRISAKGSKTDYRASTVRTHSQESLTLGRLTTELSPLDFNSTDTITYTYDKLNRLTGVFYESGVAIIFTYDKAGNRTSLQVSGGVSNPLISGLSPDSATAGTAAFTLIVNGSNFASDSVVQWNGASRGTTFVSPTQLNVSILASDVANAAVVNITVVSFGNLVSNTVAFTVSNETPTITNISIQDAKLAEPSLGLVNMIFTVTLSAPAPIGGISVNFTTMQEPPAVSHATAGSDYTTTSGTVNFATGEQFKTILVPVLSDGNNGEQDETFLVVLSSSMNGTIIDDTGVGTITTGNAPGRLLISELRTRGPGGSADEFIEIYNASGADHTVADLGAGTGYAVAASDGVARCVIPNGTVIPNRGHYLCTNSVAYSLGAYATGDTTYTTNIPDNAGIALFNTSVAANFTLANRLDAVGSTSEANTLYKEGTGYPALTPFSIDYAFVRDECGKSGSITTFGNCPSDGAYVDTNNNAADFYFVDTNGTSAGAGQRLGAPGPQNLMSPIQRNVEFQMSFLDATASGAGPPNRVRDFTSDPAINSTFGTIDIRRRVVNNTGGTVTKLRYRIIDLSTFPASSGIADLRARTSPLVVVSGINDSATCLASNGVATTPCTVNVQGTTLEQPPSQLNGGAFNSTLSVGTITLGTPLEHGASINIRFLFGVQQSGSFKFFVNVEAVP